MENKTSDDGLLHILVKIGEEKKDLRVKELSNIHPIYEALTALLKRNLPDNSIVARYAKDENSLRESIAAEVLLDHMKPNKKQGFISSFQSGAALKDIIDNAAIRIAEDKRTKDGKILYLASKEADYPYFYEALKSISPSNIYIESSAMGEIKEKAEMIQKRKKLVKIAAGISGLVLLVGAYAVHKTVDISVHYKNSDVKNITAEYKK